MPSRREILSLLPAAALQLHAAQPKMHLAIHQTTSLAAGFRPSLEGYARAGIKSVEIIAPHLDPFLKSDGLPAARRLLSNLGLTPVSHGGRPGIWEPSPEHAKAIDEMKRNAEAAAALGIDRLMAPCTATGKFTPDDYKTVIAHMREAGDIAKQFNVTLMMEFTRSSTLIGTLPTVLRLTREAAHPNVKPMLDFYHFWTGLSKFEDLDLIRPGELHHVHIQDVPDMPRELLDSITREIPGTGVAPTARILAKLREKQYTGPLSLELFYPKYQQTDPYEMAMAFRKNAEPFL
jgi:2-keto-myo-inositol isomerase